MRIACVLLLSLVAGGAVAQPDAERPFRLSGFGTLGVLHSSEDQADYMAGQYRPSGAGYSDEWSHSVDSRLGAQLDYERGRWSAVVQVVSEQGHDGAYTPAVEWANLTYELRPSLTVRAGRTVLPIFMVADSRKVSYANPWMRPPAELYAMVPLTSSDGVDASWRGHRGRWTFTTQANFGHAKIEAPPDVMVHANSLAGLYLTAEAGSLTLRGAYGRMRLGWHDLDGLFDAFRAFGPQGEGIADRYSVHRKRADIVTVGASYQVADWFVMAEGARSNTRSLFGAHSAWFLSAGRRFGDFTPYVSYARLSRDDAKSAAGLDTSGLPPDLAAIATQLNAVLNATLGAAAEQRTTSVGVRWDFRPRMAVKVQWDRVAVDAGSPGLFANWQPGFQRGGEADLIGVSLDFVF